MSEATRPAKETAGNNPATMLLVVMMFALVLLPLLYVLSVGPVVMMVDRGGMDREFWTWFYAPLEWLHSHVEFVRPFLEWYIELWR